MRGIEPDERVRVARFMFREDARATLLGRLMLRAAAQQHLGGCAWSAVPLTRSASGRPMVAAARAPSVNLSHDGGLLVVAGEADVAVGVDVMRIALPRGVASVGELFQQTRSTFSAAEWRRIEGEDDRPEARLDRFYAHWCAKEAYVKMLGCGLVGDLRQHEVHVEEGYVAVAGRRLPNVHLEQHRITDEHRVAVAISGPAARPYAPFEWQTADALLALASPLDAASLPPEQQWRVYMAKPESR